MTGAGATLSQTSRSGPPSRAVPEMPVRDEAVMTRRERVLFRVLTMVAALMITTFGVVWTRAALAGPLPGVSLALVLLVLLALTVWGIRWGVLPRMRRPVPMPARTDLRVAAVTTFVPGHEPIEMLELTLRALVAMEEAHDTWLLDEGDDPAVKALCAQLGVRHFSRRGIARLNTPEGRYRDRSKHGNYNAWLECVGYDRYDVLAAFDTDHVPEPGYLTQTLGYFADPAVAFAQPAQVYYNQSASFIAQGAAEETYAYYSSHLMASYALGHAIVIGSHSVHRMTALSEVGGFPDHDAEDLYITMLYSVGGWRGVYVPEVLARGTTPTDWRGYLTQQLRWSRSVLDLKLRVFPPLTPRMSPRERAINLLHGAFYLRPLAIPLVFLLLAYVLVAGQRPGVFTVDALVAFVALTTVLTVVDSFRQRYYLDPAHESGMHWRAILLQMSKWPMFVIAVRDAMGGTRPVYAITSKTNQAGESRAYARVHWLVAAAISVAWGVGSVLHGTLPWELSASAALVVALSVGLAWTHRWQFQPTFIPGLLERRRARLGDAA